MKTDKPLSALEAFCKIVGKDATGREDFALLTTESVPDFAELSAIPEEKIFIKQASPHTAILSAAGLALSGMRPWVLGRAIELIGESYAHIREVVAIPSLPVRFAAIDGGLSSVGDSAAKQFFADLAIARTIPGMNVFVPSDEAALAEIITESLSANSPLYLQLSGTPLPLLEIPSGEMFGLGGARILRSGTDVTICSCGVMTQEALLAAARLELQNISAEVIDCSSLKPFPEQALFSSIRKTGCCVAAEAHSTIGGLYGAVAECLGRSYPVPLRSVSVHDEFVNSGAPEELREYYGLTWKEIVDAAVEVWTLGRR